MSDGEDLAPFATVEDLEARWRGLSEQEQARARVLLEDASDVIRTRAPRWRMASVTTLRRICCALVVRAMMSNSSGAGTSGDHEAYPRGVVASETHTTGPFSDTYTYSNPDGSLYLKRDELRDLGGRAGGAFSVDLVTGEVIGHG